MYRFTCRSLKAFRLSQVLAAALVTGSGLYVVQNASAAWTPLPLSIVALSGTAAVSLFCSLCVLLSAHRSKKLSALKARINETEQTLEQARDVHAQFLEQMRGELNVPALGMQGEIASMQERGLALHPKSRANLQRASDCAQKLLTFTTDLLDLSRGSARRLDIQRSTFDLIDTVRAVAAATQSLVLSRSVAVAIQAPDSLLVHSDEQRVRQVLTKLSSNAAKFTESGTITFLVHEDQGIVLEVADTGIGVVPEAQELIFEAFRRTGVTDGGPGLGLALVQHVVHALGGTVQFHSTPKAGSVFRVRLGPIAANTSQAQTAGRPSS